MKWAAILFSVIGGGVILVGVIVIAMMLSPNLIVGKDQNPTPTNQALNCEQVVAQLEQVTNRVDCSSLSDSSACYGNRRVDVKSRGAETLVFNNPGDREMLAKLSSISTKGLDFTTGEWGMALLSTRVIGNNQAVTNQPLIFVLYGDTTVEDASGNPTSNAHPENLHAFYFDTRTVGLVPECRDLPVGGLIIDSPDGFQVSFTANGAEITIASTVILQASPYVDMTVTVLEGKAIVTSGGQNVTATAGKQAVIPLGAGHNGLEANGPPQLRDANSLAIGLPSICRIMAWSGLNVPCNLPAVVPGPTPTITPFPSATAPPTPIGPYVTANVNANVRTGDTTQHNVVGVLATGQTAPVVGVSCTGSGWYVIRLNQQQGFISSTIVTLTGSISGLPCFNPPPLPTPSDTDRDGFNDTVDQCPTIPGIDNGCPPPTPIDLDMDGFGGDLDRCPDIPGTDNGCPPPTATIEPTPEFLPDLIVEIAKGGVNVDCDGPDCYTSIDFYVSNTERGEAIGPFVIEAYASGLGPWETEISQLRGGTSISLTADWVGSCYNPDCAITITVDTRNAVDETSDENNTASFSRLG